MIYEDQELRVFTADGVLVKAGQVVYSECGAMRGIVEETVLAGGHKPQLLAVFLGGRLKRHVQYCYKRTIA